MAGCQNYGSFLGTLHIRVPHYNDGSQEVIGTKNHLIILAFSEALN